MGFYLRKALTRGPVRFNFSRGGVGLSAGVTGARVGVNRRGAYVHGGRGGMYYRKQIGSKGRRSRAENQAGESADAGQGCLLLIGIVVVLVAGIWLLANPQYAVLALLVGGGVVFYRHHRKQARIKRLQRYIDAINDAFLGGGERHPDLPSLRATREVTLADASLKEPVRKVESQAYTELLGEVLEDGRVTVDESEAVSAAEQLFDIDADRRVEEKKAFFTEYYLAAVADQEVDEDELKTLDNLRTRLHMPREAVDEEMRLVGRIIEAQRIQPPLYPCDPESIPVHTKRNETPYLHTEAQVLSRRKDRNAPGGYAYTVRRDGDLVLTDKRAFVVKEGTTNLHYSDLADIEVDLDEDFIVVSKATSSRPMFLRVDDPLRVARYMDILMGGNQA